MCSRSVRAAPPKRRLLTLIRPLPHVRPAPPGHSAGSLGGKAERKSHNVEPGRSHYGQAQGVRLAALATSPGRTRQRVAPNVERDALTEDTRWKRISLSMTQPAPPDPLSTSDRVSCLALPQPLGARPSQRCAPLCDRTRAVRPDGRATPEPGSSTWWRRLPRRPSVPSSAASRRARWLRRRADAHGTPWPARRMGTQHG